MAVVRGLHWVRSVGALRLFPAAVLMLFALGCSDQRTTSTDAPAAATSAPSLASDTDAWIGRWTGPEGTFLQIDRQDAGYAITVRNLDGPRSFAGVAAQSAIRFERDGSTETIRAGNGAETGMKWLAEKSDCLVVKAGEGYCRD